MKHDWGMVGCLSLGVVVLTGAYALVHWQAKWEESDRVSLVKQSKANESQSRVNESRRSKIFSEVEVGVKKYSPPTLSYSLREGEVSPWVQRGRERAKLGLTWECQGDAKVILETREQGTIERACGNTSLVPSSIVRLRFIGGLGGAEVRVWFYE